MVKTSERLYEIHEAKKQELYSMTLAEAMKNWPKTGMLIQSIEFTGDMLNLQLLLLSMQESIQEAKKRNQERKEDKHG